MHSVEQYILGRDDIRHREEETFNPLKINGGEFESPVATRKEYFVAPENEMSLLEFTRWSDDFLAGCKKRLPPHSGQFRGNRVWRDRIYLPLLSFVHTEATARINAPQADITIHQDSQEIAAFKHDYKREQLISTRVRIGLFPCSLYDHVEDVERGWTRETLGKLNESFAEPGWLERQVEKYRLQPSKFI